MVSLLDRKFYAFIFYTDLLLLFSKKTNQKTTIYLKYTNLKGFGIYMKLKQVKIYLYLTNNR